MKKNRKVLADIVSHLSSASELLETYEANKGWQRRIDEVLQEMNGKDQVLNALNGSYRLISKGFELQLRIDKKLKIISGDLFAISQSAVEYRFSFRSIVFTDFPVLRVFAEDGHGRKSVGTIEFLMTKKKEVAAQVVFDEPIGGLLPMSMLELSGKRVSTKYRSLGLEQDCEEGASKEPVFLEGKKEYSISASLAKAGFDLKEVGNRNEIPSPQGGWDTSQLHGLMSQFAQEKLDRPSWNLHVLQLQKPAMRGLLGVMFDSGTQDLNQLPRQGVAVFQEPMKGYKDFERKLIQTTVHEVGHALNLVHRFERVVGRMGSTSFMNYDWKYKGGGKSTEFWKQFSFSFDKDELAFLRHARPFQVMPGGAEFHEIPYWENFGEGYVPYFPEYPTSDLSLEVFLPESGPVFSFGQPIVLGVGLTNETRKNIEIPAFMLDLKSGFLEFEIIKRPSTETSQASVFRPLFHRFYQYDEFKNDVLKPGETIENNVNLTFGSAGFSFAEPGIYELGATFYYQKGQKYYTIQSPKVFIKVASPENWEEEKEALALLQPKVGLYWVLGGSDRLADVKGVLEEVKQSRIRRVKDAPDGIIANIVRTQSFNKDRCFVNYHEGSFSMRAAQEDEAKALLSTISTDDWGICFDKYTRNQMLNV